jgi:DNA-binding MarR family transcriptional regulator|tara:strand:- start:4740 stop:4985 length:246 start_codon:yes stop_codon:yes gene_type:complete
MSIELVNWLKDGNYRIPILKLLENKNYLSSELAKHFEVNRASMSRILKVLGEKKLVESISNGSRTVTYVITKKGKDVIKDL